MNDDEFNERISQTLNKSLDTVDDADLERLRKARRAALAQATVNEVNGDNVVSSINPGATAQSEKQANLHESKAVHSKTPVYAMAASLTALALVTLLMLNPNNNNGELSSSLAIEGNDPEILLELEFLETMEMLAALSDIAEDANSSFDFSSEPKVEKNDNIQVM